MRLPFAVPNQTTDSPPVWYALIFRDCQKVPKQPTKILYQKCLTYL